MNPMALRELVLAAVKESKCSPVEVADFLHECLPTPVSGVVTVDAFHARNLELDEGHRAVWFITQSDPQSVFFDIGSGRFGTCWGPERGTGIYQDLGFRSDDPVEMFLV